MRTWNNVYMVNGYEYPFLAVPETRPADAQMYASLPQNAPTWIRVEMRYNDHWHRPPVGMQAGQASHEWIARLVGPYGSITFEDKLEPRK